MDQCSPCQKPLANMIAVHMVSFIHLYIQSCVCVCFLKSVKAGKLNLSELEFFNGSFFGQFIAKDSKLWT